MECWTAKRPGDVESVDSAREHRSAAACRRWKSAGRSSLTI